MAFEVLHFRVPLSGEDRADLKALLTKALQAIDETDPAHDPDTQYWLAVVRDMPATADGDTELLTMAAQIVQHARVWEARERLRKVAMN